MQKSARLRVPPQVVHREVDGETVVMQLDTGRYYALDEVGSRIWALLQEEGGAIDRVAARLSSEYAVAEAEAQRDVAHLVDQLLAKALLQRG